MPQRSKRLSKEKVGKAQPVTRPAPFMTESAPERPVEELFAGPRPASFLSALEPAFLLIDRAVMEQLRTKAAALGLGGYDSLVKRILREHIAEY